MRRLGQALIPPARNSSIVVAPSFLREWIDLMIQKIFEDVKARVIPEARRKMRISRQKGRRGITGPVQRGSDRGLSGRETDHIPAQGERIARSHHGRK